MRTYHCLGVLCPEDTKLDKSTPPPHSRNPTSLQEFIMNPDALIRKNWNKAIAAVAVVVVIVAAAAVVVVGKCYTEESK
jgi:hypothetical protein